MNSLLDHSLTDGHMVHHLDKSMDSGEDTDMEDIPPGVGGQCTHPSCAYGGHDDIVNVTRRRYVCRKCSSEKTGILTLCSDCHDKCAHYRHRKYFDIISDG